MTSTAPPEARLFWPSAGDPTGAPDIGGKARGLLEITAAGLHTPAWFAVPAPVLANSDHVAGDLAEAIVAAARAVAGPTGRLAVRSSASDEDSTALSFAGQHLTVLGVEPELVPQAVLRCRRSADGEAVSAYRTALGMPAGSAGLAVVVQAMVSTRCAGVCFSDAPERSPGEAVIVAGPGLADRLVAGETDGEEYRVDATEAVRVSHPFGSASERVLADGEARAIARAARVLARRAGRAQDVEWAIDDAGRLHVLQARPVTAALPSPPSNGSAETRLWDNANIVESFPGITLPLTYSVARDTYAAVYRGAVALLGVERGAIVANGDIFEQLLGHIDGRVYYNVSSWHRLLALLPGFGTNQPLLERMMGAARPGAASSEGATPVTARSGGRLAGVRFAFRMLVGVLLFERRARAFERSIARLGDEVRGLAVERLTADALLAEIDRATARAVAAWPVTIFNDLAVMIVHGSLRRSAELWLEPAGQTIVNDLLRGDGLASTAPAQELEQLAARLRERPAALESLRATARPAESLGRDPQLSWLSADIAGYLDRWGDRCPHELKLDQPSFRDDPEPLIAALIELAGRPPTDRAERRNSHAGQRAAWRDIDSRLRPAGRVRRLLRRRALRWLVRRARHHLVWRERMRFARTEVFALARQLFGALDARMVGMGALGRTGDLHYLDIAEVRGLLRGTGALEDPLPVVANRRARFAEYGAMRGVPDRFETGGPPALHGSRRRQHGPAEADEGVELRGLAVSPGVVRGQCRLVVDPRRDRVGRGQIIIAHSTDPGWLPLLLAAGGLLVERGNLLSHSAIVARELGLPAIVGIAGLSRRLRDGDVVEMNGATGSVRLLATGDR